MNECKTCVHWRRISVKRGSCAKSFVSQGNRIGYLLTRCFEGCAHWKLKDEFKDKPRQTHVGEIRYGR